MAYYCTKCSLMKGITVTLEKDSLSDEYFCPINPKHRFKVDQYGMIHSVE
ncbi:MAG: hypothetical protein PHF51_02260 [Candidatus ainarchaeum sp.]|nr:hypothetical protein [Candidatus ainarchaeum sp.]